MKIMKKKLDTSKFLDLKNDIVFKIFFAAAKNKSLLISFLEAILDPGKEIEDVEVLNPTLPKEVYEDKGVVLDLVVRFKDQTRVDIEMQVEDTTGFRKRILYYWSRLHQSQLQAGEFYKQLAPTISIAVLAYEEFKNTPDEVHSIFELRERSTAELFLPDMQLHFIELPKYDRWKKKQEQELEKDLRSTSQQPQSHLDQWIQFFKINNLSETQTQKLLEEPIMSKAFNALEEISNDPESKALAELREKARINLHIITSEAKAAAKAEGIEVGKAEGKAEGIEIGVTKGKAEGIEIGVAKGKAENIRRMSEKGYPANEIARVFDMSEEEVQNILKMPYKL